MNRVKSSSAYKIYQDGGLESLLTAVWIYTLQNTVLADGLKKVLSESRHEQIIAFPSIGYWPQIETPRSFNEKIMHRKLFTDNELFVKVSDKYRVREYVTNHVGPEILTDLYHVTEAPETIPFEELPEEFVLKGTHGSGMNTIVLDKQEADFEALVSEANQWLEWEYGSHTDEYWYTDITPRIIVEEYIENDRGKAPRDYKFYVFDGTVQYVHVDHARFSDHTRRFYDRDWNPQEFTRKYPLGPVIDEPADLDGMIEVAEQLGEAFDFMRVDLYNPEPGRIVFGEMTVAPGAGHGRFEPTDVDFEFGSHW